MILHPNEQLIVEAIREKKPISFHYQGYYREACPHCLGSYKNKRRVLVYQYAGEGSKGPISTCNEKNWRAMHPEDMIDIDILDAKWVSHTSYVGPGRMFDLVDFEVR
ncbi:MAG: hypothetical protein ACYC64_09335 [Armatimonadota bacterium]